MNLAWWIRCARAPWGIMHPTGIPLASVIIVALSVDYRLWYFQFS